MLEVIPPLFVRHPAPAVSSPPALSLTSSRPFSFVIPPRPFRHPPPLYPPLVCRHPAPCLSSSHLLSVVILPLPCRHPAPVQSATTGLPSLVIGRRSGWLHCACRPHCLLDSFNNAELSPEMYRVQELCWSRGGRPGLPVLMSLTVSVDVKQY